MIGVLFRSWAFVCLFLQFLCFADDSKDGTVNIRAHIRDCAVYVLEQAKDDSQGKRLADLNEEALTATLRAYIADHGPQSLDGRHLYLTGVPMGGHADAKQKVEKILSSVGADPKQVTLHVLSVPREWSEGFLRALVDRLIYFFPSIQRDFQKPLVNEVLAGLATSAVVETGSILFLFDKLPPVDAAWTVSVHAALLGSMTCFRKFLNNWVQRSDSLGVVFVKQVLTSVPFIANFLLLGNLSAIQAYYQAHGLSGLLTQLPIQAAAYASSQVLTTVLQTLFYTWAIARGIGRWEMRQKSTEDAVAAREFASIAAVPWLWFDAIFLAKASSHSAILFTVGQTSIYSGQAYLAGLTAAGTLLILKPALLDIPFRWYKKARRAIARWIWGESPSPAP